MSLEMKYQKAYENLGWLTGRREAEKSYTALGYTSNLDYLCSFDMEVLNKLLEQHLPGICPGRMQAFHKIETQSELLQTIVFYCLNGIGGEAEFEEIDLFREIVQWTYGIGGTAAQAAMALAAVECSSVIHLTDDSWEVCDILDSPYIYTVSESGELMQTGGIQGISEQEVHCIIQFKKGDQICHNGQRYKIPVSNRLILTKMTVNKVVPLSIPFFEFIERNAGQLSSIVLSSFNEILDRELCKKRMHFMTAHIAKYRLGNPGGVVFFEDAHYHSRKIHKLCLELLYPSLDIVSLNEEELEYTLKMFGYPIDLDDIISCVKGMKYIKNRFGVRRGVIVHTKDYAMYVGEWEDMNIEDGLIYGNLLATAKAAYGWYGAKEQIEEVLKLGCSKIGLKKRKLLLASKYAGAAVLIPSKYIDKPQYTIGLGDSFVAGVQMCFRVK